MDSKKVLFHFLCLILEAKTPKDREMQWHFAALFYCQCPDHSKAVLALIQKYAKEAPDAALELARDPVCELSKDMVWSLEDLAKYGN